MSGGAESRTRVQTIPACGLNACRCRPTPGVARSVGGLDRSSPLDIARPFGTFYVMGRQLGDCDICGKPRIAKGLCDKHYQRLRQGLPLDGEHLQPVGENSPNAKLTADDVRDIRRLRNHGYTLRWIGHKYKISNVSVYNLLSGKTYRDVE